MKKKILIIQNQIPHYRVGFYNHLAEIYDVTVAHSGKENGTDRTVLFKEEYLKLTELGPFYFQKGIKKLLKSNKYDAYIMMFDIRWLSNIILLFSRRRKKILWGNRYSKNKTANFIRNLLMKRANAHILYSECEIHKMIKAGIPKGKIFIAYNTMLISNSGLWNDIDERNNLLFVGRAQKRKRVDLLIKAFSEIKDRIPESTNINIIGEGNENKYLKELVNKLQLDNRIKFHGKITEEEVLKEFFHKAIAYVSPGPVGLGVLHSLAYGIPIITLREGKHGPEFSNIKNNVNGIICGNYNDLKNQLIKICNNRDLAENLGINAFNHYSKERTLNIMRQGFIDAIEKDLDGRIF